MPLFLPSHSASQISTQRRNCYKELEAIWLSSALRIFGIGTKSTVSQLFTQLSNHGSVLIGRGRWHKQEH